MPKEIGVTIKVAGVERFKKFLYSVELVLPYIEREIRSMKLSGIPDPKKHDIFCEFVDSCEELKDDE